MFSYEIVKISFNELIYQTLLHFHNILFQLLLLLPSKCKIIHQNQGDQKAFSRYSTLSFQMERCRIFVDKPILRQRSLICHISVTIQPNLWIFAPLMADNQNMWKMQNFNEIEVISWSKFIFKMG